MPGEGTPMTVLAVIMGAVGGDNGTELDVEMGYRSRVEQGLRELDWLIRTRVKLHVQSTHGPHQCRVAKLLGEAKHVRDRVLRHQMQGQLYAALDELHRYNIRV
jgi:hypothetical protein